MQEDEEQMLTKTEEHLLSNTILANERTYAAWIRTGLTTLAVAVGFERMLQSALHPIALKTGVIVLLFASWVFFLIAAQRYWMMWSHVKPSPIHFSTVIVLCLLAIAMAGLALIAFLGLQRW